MPRPSSALADATCQQRHASLALALAKWYHFKPWPNPKLGSAESVIGRPQGLVETIRPPATPVFDGRTNQQIKAGREPRHRFVECPRSESACFVGVFTQITQSHVVGPFRLDRLGLSMR